MKQFAKAAALVVMVGALAGSRIGDRFFVPDFLGGSAVRNTQARIANGRTDSMRISFSPPRAS